MNECMNEMAKYLEDFVSLFISGDGPDGHDEGMTGIVDAGLNDVVQRESRWRRKVAKIGVDFPGQTFRHPVVMLKKRWKGMGRGGREAGRDAVRWEEGGGCRWSGSVGKVEVWVEWKCVSE